ncbi:glycosyltransferase family 2 protein [Oceanicella actignis]|uniref:glycosyltransferase family 2 protein n=1 Tax=Oceanicella actignis TaxID=1189325 RepID=UPI0011E693E8|nr:glycosyltransferase [Oceanicella actignis]TYO88752.1 GT2 family glycosyltransferase [Oceanicella actignis]
MSAPAADVGVVAIGRNEGERLRACLRAARRDAAHVVYVDSGSTDGSVAAARALGAETVALDMSIPFTAARARNAGLAHLRRIAPRLPLVQFVDGDCELREGWIAAARAFLARRPEVAAVCGRRRERRPDASIYNAACDAEWDTPVGEALACGGDALMRIEAIEQVGGWRDSLIAGEEPELCVRLRAAGWRIWRLDAEMTWHDADMRRFGQWWRRSVRAGHAFAEGAALHGAPPERHWVAETRRALLWGAALPAAALAGAALVHPAALGLLAAWPAQTARLALRARGAPRAWPLAALTVLGKAAEAQGALRFMAGRALRRPSRLIEYRRPARGAGSPDA